MLQKNDFYLSVTTYSELQKYWDRDTCLVLLDIHSSTFKLKSYNDRMLKCRMSVFISGDFHPYRVNHLEIKAIFVHSPHILGDQKYWDKFTSMYFRVVKSEVFGPIFIAHNDYIKLVTVNICWMLLLFVLIVFQMILCPI